MHPFRFAAWHKIIYPKWAAEHQNKSDGWTGGSWARTQHPPPSTPIRALLAPTEDLAGWATALWRPCLRQIVRAIVHLFYQFTDLLCGGSPALITTASEFTHNLLDSISSDVQQNIGGPFAQAEPKGNWKRSCFWLPPWEVQGSRWKGGKKKMSRSMVLNGISFSGRLYHSDQTSYP